MRVKKVVFFVLVFFLFLSFTNYIVADDKLYGDINGDGKINDADLTMLNNYIMNEIEHLPTGLSDEEWTDTWNKVRANGDLDGDGGITYGDRDVLMYILQHGHTKSGQYTATSCAGFYTENACKAGVGKDNNRFGCAWNEKYEFCSVNGLVYLSCGNTDNKTDAHDIPVMVPRLTSYGVTILKTVTPVILIIISMFQLIKAIASQNEDEMKKAKSSLIKKLIISVLIFFVTTIVQFIIKQVADDTELGSSSQCLSCFVNNDCNGAMYFVDGYGYCYYLTDKDNPIASTTGNCRTDIGILNGLVSDDNSSDNNKD